MEKKETIEIRVTGKHGKLNLAPEIYDINDIKGLLEDIEYLLRTEYDEKYLDQLIKQASGHWSDIDPDEWLKELRGGYQF